MSIVGRYWVCGEHQPPFFFEAKIEPIGTTEPEWLGDVTTAYPFPIALVYRGLREDLVANRCDRDALGQLIRLKDVVETFVKYLAIVALSARLDRRDTFDALDRQILEKLVAPSLGTWAQDILQPLVRVTVTREDPRLVPLVQFATGKVFGTVQEFTSLRNKVLGHGLARAPREDRLDVNAWLPRLNVLLAGARFLAGWELVQAVTPPRSWMGADAEADPRPARTGPARLDAVQPRPGEFLLVTTEGRPISLYPFIYVLMCPRCSDARRLFLYDSQKVYTTERKKVAMIEPVGRHKEDHDEPGRALAERFDEQMLLEYYRSHRRHFEVLEGKLTEFDFDTYRKRVEHFIGRRPVLGAIDAFLNHRPIPLPDGLLAPVDRGYFLLVAEPGLGKTALLTHWIDHNDACPVPIRFFWRRGRDLTALDFLRHVYHGLLKKHNIADQEPPQEDLKDYERKLDSLLKLISEKYLAEAEREVIVIDGLDEAGDSHARQLGLSVLPHELPRHVYVLLSSRPVRELDLLNREATLRRYVLPADADWNRADLREYLECQLGTLLTTGELDSALLPAIEAAADGNFLWAEQFSLAVRTERLPAASIRDALPRIQGLDSLYQEFWTRILQDLPKDVEARIWRLAGTLAVARTALTAEQLCRFAGLEDGEFIALRALVQQYLDEVELPNDRDPSTPLIGFRFYHTSFRDFILRQPGLVPAQHHDRIVRSYLSAETDHSPSDYGSWDRYGLSFMVHHAVEAQRWDAVGSLLLDLFFLEAKAEAGRVFGLATDFQLAVERMRADHPRRRIVQLLKQALGYDIHFISRHPTTLFQCLWNQCWWYDCPEAAAHYEPPDGGWPSEGTPWSCPEPNRLSTLLESWRTAKDRRSPGFIWIRSLRPPELSLHSTQIACFRGHEHYVISVAFDPTGRRIASASHDGTVRLWEASTGVELLSLRGHKAPVVSVAFDPTGRRFGSGGYEPSVRVWDATTGVELSCLRGHEGYVRSLAYSPDGRRIASGSEDKTVRVWEADSGAELSCLRGHESPVMSVAYSPDGGCIASGSWDKTVRVWDADSGAEVSCFRGHESRVTSVAYSPDGRRIASGSLEGVVRIWDARSGAELACFPPMDSRVLPLGSDSFLLLVGSRVTFDPSGQRVAIGSFDGIVRVWDAAAGTELARFGGHGDQQATGVAFDPTGRCLVSGGFDRTVRLWTTSSGTQAPLHDHEKRILSVAVDPTGRRIASGSRDEPVRIWDADSGTQLACLSVHEIEVARVVFDPTGRRLAAGSRDNTGRVWAVDTGECLEVLTRWGDIGWFGEESDFHSCWRVLTGRLETMIAHSEVGPMVAWFPEALEIIAGHPSGRVWAGSAGNHLYIIRLEGAD
jgi:WD40 repeat protein